MRHRLKTKQFNRDTKERKALLKSLVSALVERGQIVTTKQKAKETKRIADKLIHKAQKGDLASRRVIHKFFGKRSFVNTLTDKIAPLFDKRVSGFSRITKVGTRRGDNTEMVRLELVKQPEANGLKNTKDSKKVIKKTKTAKKVVKKEAKKVAAKPAKKASSKSTKKAEKTK